MSKATGAEPVEGGYPWELSEAWSESSWVLREGPEPATGRSTAVVASWLQKTGCRYAWARPTPDLDEPYDPYGRLLGRLLSREDAGGNGLSRRFAGLLAALGAGSVPALDQNAARSYSSWLAAYVRTGQAWRLRDFFQGRNLSIEIAEELTVAIEETAMSDLSGPPLVLWLEGTDALAPEAQAVTLRLLERSRWNRIRFLFQNRGALPSWLAELVQESRIRECRGAARRTGEGAPSGTETLLMRTLQACRRPLRRPALASLLAGVTEPAPESVLARCLEHGWVVEPEPGWLALGSDGVLLLPPSSNETPDPLLARALTFAVTEGDVYLKALVAREAGDPRCSHAALEAASLAWSVSAYRLVEKHLLRALEDENVPIAVSPSTALALLAYEEGRFEAAEDCFLKALQETSDSGKQLWLRWLRGYNRVFGLRDHVSGLELLRGVEHDLEHQGRLREAVWVRNSMAFSLLALGKASEAKRLELEALELSKGLDRADRFQLMILNLNLGRLERSGDPAQVEARVQQALQELRGETSVSLLMLAHLTLAGFLLEQREYRSAARWLETVRTLLLEAQISRSATRNFSLLEKPLSRQGLDLATSPLSHSLQLSLLLSLQLDQAYRGSGCPALADRHRSWVERCLREGGESPVSWGSGNTEPSCPRARGRVAPAARWRGLVSWRKPRNLASWLARCLEAGEDVAWYCERQGELITLESLVLFNPTLADRRSTLSRWLRQRSESGALIALAQADEWFRELEPFPDVLQRTSLRRDRRASVPGAQPIQTMVWIIPPERTGLQQLLAAFFARTGVPFLGALPLRLGGEGPADSMDAATKVFLETGILHLAAEGRTATKLLGPTAAANRQCLRPRLLVGLARGSHEDERVLITRTQRIRVSAEAAELLERCDGRTRVTELLPNAEAGRMETACRFLTQLQEKGALHFSL